MTLVRVAAAALLAACAATSVSSRTVAGRRVVTPAVSPDAYAHYLRSRLYAEHGLPAEAARELRAALRHDGASAWLRFRLAEALAAAGDRDAALAQARLAVELDAGLDEARALACRLAPGDRAACPPPAPR